ncbi:DEAD/DEAH box helicase [Nocardioides sp. BP30]|uniref:DEAD/DEAH box helicase n=1 Tax=Nocardioides sp. BP30 TaxID=3036374 RepID=UPI002468BA10|nr:DEAD/DEAH box helicase [Nocardioides sp. BP30]WGL52645.1 DEAD/DEAH box helicase [Nocardioides sp. BP30]
MSSLYSLAGAAAFRPAQPPRASVVEFGGGRTVSMPMAAAIPVLSKAHRREDLHPSVALLTGAVMLGLRLVAAGRIEPGEGLEPGWRAVVEGDDQDRVAMLASSRAYGEVDVAAAEQVVRAVLDAVADAMPRAAPTPGTRQRRAVSTAPAGAEPQGPPRDAAFQDRLRARLARHVTAPAGAQLPQLVSLSLRVEADEEELVGGSIRVVPQAHDDSDPLHVVDAARLWHETWEQHGFGDRARTHALVALRGAAEAWPVLDRLLDLPVPDEITLDGDELASLLEDGVAALKGRGVDVLWPRSLTPELTAQVVVDRAGAPQEDLMQDGLFGVEQTCAFQWQLAIDGVELTEAEMDALATAAAPVLKLRGSWTVVHPSITRKARKRLLRRVTGTEALATALTGALPEKVAESLAEEAPAEHVVVGASIGRLRDRVAGVVEAPLIPVPADLRAELRDYQRRGLTWLAEITGLGLGGCLADDMGLGKTITLIALHLHRCSTLVGPTLVVCPASLLGNWEAEIARFAPGVPVRRFHGAARDLDGVTAGFVLTTYGTMRRDAAALSEVPWDLVVADEAQHLKNAASATARAIRTIGSRARVALTGTPVENNLTELWAILDWCVPGLLGSRLAFRRAWASPIEAGVDERTTQRFAALIAPFLLRRRKSDPGIAPELPAKTETDHPLALTREQAVLYESFVRDSLERIERADPITRRGLVLMLLTGLKQICNHPAQFLKQHSGRIAGRSQKIDLLDELLETVLAEDGAVLVFTQYVAMARLLEAHWAATGVPHQFLHGGTPVAERERMVRRFQDPADPHSVPVFLLSLQAGGVGLNLTRADHVVHVDRWWNPAVEDQATDRAYRIGQTKPVQVHRLVTRGTVEEKVAELLTRKRALAEAVLGSGEAALTELSDAELRDLVSLT